MPVMKYLFGLLLLSQRDFSHQTSQVDIAYREYILEIRYTAVTVLDFELSVAGRILCSCHIS